MKRLLEEKLKIYDLIKIFVLIIQFNFVKFLLIFILFFIPDQIISFVVFDILKINNSIISLFLPLLLIIFTSLGWCEIYSLIKNQVDSDLDYKMFRDFNRNWYKYFVTGIIFVSVFYGFLIIKEISIN
ncbi:MAG: hypothetical protein A2086_12580 [Spirochaetes bacterium GWD1_27_9]|nr:MAG: hypothetical protein A2Z98_10870 [Spirochaetes bacterium GWB1_27_13]OHD23466.1 MAG: hypothetical protein A2Y34_14135 [Spirochaetes bacterium GWC1_27_15]OHD44294.1 MAG: hypothetical protein A2086_12580 [Spirochaetes bacterium GWD1_27_9]